MFNDENLSLKTRFLLWYNTFPNSGILKSIVIGSFLAVWMVGCIHTQLKPLPPMDPSNPNVLSEKDCKDSPKIWWGQQGNDPSKTKLWKCGAWKLYDKSVAP